MQDSGLKRNTLINLYYSQLVDDCINNISKFIIIDKKNDIVIEPSAGDGSFINLKMYLR